MYKLRNYQEDLINKIFASWAAEKRRVMAQLPTGGGKTVVFAHVGRKFLEQGEGVLVVAHRKELILQAKEKLEEISGLECGMIKAGFPVHPDRDIQVASIQSLTRRKRYPEVGLVIVDEAHHACAKSYTTLLEKYPNAYILGMTATPIRIDGQGFKWIFDDLVTGVSVSELIDLGHLCKYRLFAAKPINTKGVGKSAGEFNQSQLQDIAMSIVGDVVPTWRKYADGKKTIIFATGIEHSKAIIKQFQTENIIAEHIDGDTPDNEREGIIQRFAEGQTTILSNVAVFTEGFDLPSVEAVVVARPTCSPGLWLQMVGRGLRPSPGKKHLVLIDHTENWKNHGLPDEDREWSLDPVSLNPGRFILECPDCSHCFRPLAHELKPYKKIMDAEGILKDIYQSTCPNCLTKFDWEQGKGAVAGTRILEKKDGEVMELGLDCQQWVLDYFAEIQEVQQSTNKKKGWIYYRAIEHERRKEFTLGDWRHLANVLGYKSGWAWKVWNEVQSEQAQNTSDELVPKASNQ